MENDTSNAHSPELDSLPKLELNTIAESLGFLETPNLVLIRQAIVESQTIRGDVETARTLLAEYQATGEAVVEAADHYADAQIGLIIATAAIRRAIGNIDAAVNDLQDALVYAENMGHDEELVSKLQDAITDLENEQSTE